MVESLPTMQTLHAEFTAFLSRGENPLAALSTNHVVLNGKTHKLDPLEHAHKIVDLSSDADLVRLAYRVVYRGGLGGSELAAFVNNHQRYVIQLTSTKQWKLAVHELATLHGVLTQSGKYTRVLWQTFLQGIAPGAPFPASLVASYHFLVFQTLLQCISSNVASVAKGTAELSCGVFLQAAQAFLARSNIMKWINLLGTETMRKYRSNCVKMLEGLLKVADFIKKKHPASGASLDLSLPLIRLKVLEFRARLGEDVSSQELPLLTNESRPFLEELVAALASSLVDYPELTLKIEAHLATSHTSRTQSPELERLTRKICSNQHVSLSTLSQLQLLVKLSGSPIDWPVHSQMINTLSANIDISSPDVAPILSLIDTYVSHVQNQLANDIEDVFDTLIPAMVDLLAKLSQAKRLKQLEALCFNHFKSTSLARALATAVVSQLHYAGMSSSASEFEKTRSRIERCLKSLAKLDRSKETSDLAYTYITSFHNRLKPVDLSRVVESIAPCFAYLPLQCGELWFGKLLSFDDKLKGELFTALVRGLETEILTESLVPAQLASSLHLPDQSTKINCLYRAAVAFKLHLDITSIQPTIASDHLRLAAIKTQSLYSRDLRKDKILQEIGLQIISWSESTEEICDVQKSLAIDLIAELFHLGYLKLALSTAEAIRGGHKIQDNKTKLEVSFNLLDCLLKLTQLSEIPDVLREAGGIMKSMHLEGESVDCNSLVRWKLIQLEYFIRMQDETKVEAKLQEIESLMLRYPEYNLKADAKGISLDRRLQCLSLLSQFLILTSRYNADSGSYVLALKNLKLAMKLLNSMIRRLEGSSNSRLLKLQTENLLCSSYILAYTLCRHLGLLKDAKFYLDELNRLNSVVENPVSNGFNHFQLAISNAFIGKSTEATLNFRKGSLIVESMNLSVFQAIKLESDAVLKLLLESTCKISDEELLRLQGAVECVESSTLPFEPLASNTVLEFIDDCESLVCHRTDKICLPRKDRTVAHKRQMISKAMNVVASNLREVRAMLAKEKNLEFDELIKLIPHFKNFSLNREPSDLQRKLLDCKEILQNCLEQGRSVHLEVRRAKQINAMFSRCVFLLSFVAEMLKDGTENLLNSVYSLLDLPKHLPYLNQRKVIESQSRTAAHGNELLPILSDANLSSADSLSSYVEDLKRLMPQNWVVVTIDVCALSGELVLSKYTSGDSHPLFFKMPLRGSLSALSFDDINLRLKKIIEKSNVSTSSRVTSQVKTKEDRKSWWELRFDLDLQLKRLLDDVESHVIGSFGGIFDTPNKNHHAYQSFTLKVTKIWQSEGKFNAKTFTMDSKLVELFYFAKPFNSDGMFGATRIQDLVAFTADELNIKLTKLAKLYDRLETLYTSVEPNISIMDHLVLVPSTSCCSFPWESLGILKKKSVSRLPSIQMLTNLLQEYSSSMGITPATSEKLIFCVVNPGQDLKRTQQRFEPVLKSIKQTHGLYGERPEEDYLISNIFDSDLYIYLGHGGGEQYYRSSTMLKRSLADSAKLPPAILMGCSSGAYEEYGELEPTSNVFNWLICGSPMVVTNLWDITDKDIDIFSQAVLSKWGFLPNGQLLDSDVNISHAIASSRSACTLRYLNGAAPVLHGLPLKFH